MIYPLEQRVRKTERGDTVTTAELTDRRVALLPAGSAHLFSSKKAAQGFTLIELIITVTVLTILTMGVVPLLTVSVKRQKEQQLHDALRQMRTSIDEFHRDTVGINCSGIGTGTGAGGAGAGGAGAGGAGGSAYTDPRSKVQVADCTIFGVDNPDRFPPSLESLVDGVDVVQRGGIGGGRGQIGVNASDVGGELATKKKVYLRAIPINPFTGGNKVGTDWLLRSCYDDPTANSWGGENVFDVIFPPNKDRDFKPLREGQKYSEW